MAFTSTLRLTFCVVFVSVLIGGLLLVDPRKATNHWIFHPNWPNKERAMYFPNFQAYFYRFAGSNAAITVSSVGFVDKGIGPKSQMGFFVDVSDRVIAFMYPIDQYLVNDTYPLRTKSEENCFSSFEFRVGNSIFRDDYIYLDGRNEHIIDYNQEGTAESVEYVRGEFKIPARHKKEAIWETCRHSLLNPSPLGIMSYFPFFDFYGDMMIMDAPMEGYLEIGKKGRKEGQSVERIEFGNEYRSRFYNERYFGVGFPPYWIYCNSQHLIPRKHFDLKQDVGALISRHHKARSSVVYIGMGLPLPLVGYNVHFFSLQIYYGDEKWNFNAFKGDTIEYQIRRGDGLSGIPLRWQATVRSWNGLQVEMSEAKDHFGRSYPFYTLEGRMIPGNFHVAPHNHSMSSHLNITVSQNGKVLLQTTALKCTMESHGKYQKLQEGFFSTTE